MKKYCSLTLMFGALLMLTGISACSKSKSYSELLRTEEKAVNWFMAQHEIVSSVPEDSVFEVGKDAPYYRMDEEGYVYMQVLKTGVSTLSLPATQAVWEPTMPAASVSTIWSCPPL